MERPPIEDTEAMLAGPSKPIIGYLLLDNMDDADYEIQSLYNCFRGISVQRPAAPVIDTAAEAHLPLAERTHGRNLITRCEDHELVIENLDALGSSPGHVAEAVRALWDAKVDVHIAQFAAARDSKFTLRPTAVYTRNSDREAMARYTASMAVVRALENAAKIAKRGAAAQVNREVTDRQVLAENLALKLKEDGRGPTEIARALNDAGYKPKVSPSWTRNSVHSLFKAIESRVREERLREIGPAPSEDELLEAFEKAMGVVEDREFITIDDEYVYVVNALERLARRKLEIEEVVPEFLEIDFEQINSLLDAEADRYAKKTREWAKTVGKYGRKAAGARPMETLTIVRRDRPSREAEAERIAAQKARDTERRRARRQKMVDDATKRIKELRERRNAGGYIPPK